MHFTKLFSVDWDDSYGDPDFGVPGTTDEWLDRRSPEDIERLAKHVEWLAQQLRKRESPFKCLCKHGEASDAG